MTYKEHGFRAFYHNFCVCMLEEEIKKSVVALPNVDEANCVLFYGFISENDGFCLEAIAAGSVNDGACMFYDAIDSERITIPVRNLENKKFYVVGDEASADNELYGRYALKLELLSTYGESEETRFLRTVKLIDSLRLMYYPDDIRVKLINVDIGIEECTARMRGLKDQFIIAELLDEPRISIGCHQGDMIYVSIDKDRSGNAFCYADLTPDKKLTALELEDGSLLKKAISLFIKDQTRANFIEIMRLLRDSNVWLPCSAAATEEDRRQLENIAENVGVKSEEKSEDDISLFPDILQNGSEYFYPVFTDCEEMGEYGKCFSKVQQPFTEVIKMATNNKKKPQGIVVNPFTESFTVRRDNFDTIENMLSRIIGESEK